MDYQYSGNQSYRSNGSGMNGDGFYGPMAASQPAMIHSIYPDHSGTPRNMNINGQHSNNANQRKTHQKKKNLERFFFVFQVQHMSLILKF